MSNKWARTRGARHRYRRVLIAAVAGVVLTGTAGAHQGAVGQQSSSKPIRTAVLSQGHDASTQAKQAVVAAVRAARRHDRLPTHLRPSLANLADAVASVGKCNYIKPPRELCRRGAVQSSRVLVAYGDSHAMEWIPALEAIAHRTGYAAYYLVKPGCTSASVTPAVVGHPFHACVAFHRWAMTQIEQLQPDVVFLASRLPHFLIGPQGQIVHTLAEKAPLVEAGFVKTINNALAAGVGTVYMIEDAAELPAGTSICMHRRLIDLRSCASPPLSSADVTSAAERAAAQEAGARYVHTRPWMCARGLCPAVVGSTITHRDGSHLTTVYARCLNRALQQVTGLHTASTRGRR